MANLAYIQITRDCNQKCLFCSNPPSGRQLLSLVKAKKLIYQYIKEGQDGLILTGGEPTLYPDLPNLIRYCSQKRFSCRIITNGQKLANQEYLNCLIKAGLEHINLSIYSHNSRVQNFLTRNKKSFRNIKAALGNLAKAKIRTDINITINKYNAGHLSSVVKFIINSYPFIEHFVFNNLDPTSNRAKENPKTIPCLIDFEFELHKALQFLSEHKKTFRVERVPLCYLAGFEYCSTETRKIVKQEIRKIYFLDKKGPFIQETKESFFHKKGKECKYCFLDKICAGLFGMNKYYNEKELYPIFVSKEEIIRRILL